ncbi:2-hydroxy-3-oxopropionate reductase [Vibrio variabilis]|uniref:2-hydroxy-3-oxopropionate reductase n=2 Tax=Vibrio TaxID=662 RepID=A0ABQ0J6S2_9VIBR|nr:2-hydroxy-3-oxopropionate reductase [Vibrio variabilis]
MENRAKTMDQDKYDFGFAIDWMIKDLGFCLDEAEKQGITLPLTEQSIERYKQLSADGEGRSDTSVLFKAVRQDAEK